MGISSGKISIIGSRGIPAKYGGFEVFSEQLAMRLAERGHDVSVCCEFSNHNDLDSYKGVTLHYFPIPPPKKYSLRKFYEILNDIYFISIMSASTDFLYILGVGTAGWFTFFPKLVNRNVKVIINIDGLEWKRDKFNIFEKLVLRINNLLAIFFADTVIIDSKNLIKYIAKDKKSKTIFIPYGVEIPESVLWNNSELEKISLNCNGICMVKPNRYWLVVARLEPENNIHTILKGYLQSSSKIPLIVVGDPTNKHYKIKLKKILETDDNKKIMMVGSIYDLQLLNMLRQNCFAYIHGHSVGGTNPSLLEAMIMKSIIVAHDNEFNREVCQDSALYFKDELELKEEVESIENFREDYTKLKNLAYVRACKEYPWDKIVDIYESVF